MAFRSLARGAASSFTSTAPSSASTSTFAIASTSYTASASSSSAARLFSSSARRNAHRLPPLPARISNGVAPLLSESTVKMLWNEHQQSLLEKLNNEVAGNPNNENATLATTIINTAAQPGEIMAFNYASLALNNAFFLSGIVSPPGVPQDLADTAYQNLPVSEPSTRLSSELTKAFGGVTEFKNAFSAAAYGMSGSGYLWLVWDATARKLGIVPTYGAGTILVQKRQQRGPAGFDSQASVTDAQLAEQASSNTTQPAEQQSQDQSKGPLAPKSVTQSAADRERLDRITNETQSSTSSYSDSNQPRDRILTPVMCLSVNEHAWMNDWGITGKEEYLIRFWDVIDWNRVESLLGK